MEWVTITAKTLPEAIDLALDNLGVDESEAEIVVLEEPTKGLFGRTRGSARVEARVKPRTARPKVDRGRNRRGRSNDRSRGERGGRNRRGNSDNRSKGNRSGSGSGSSSKSRSRSGERNATGKQGGGGGDRGRGDSSVVTDDDSSEKSRDESIENATVDARAGSDNANNGGRAGSAPRNNGSSEGSESGDSGSRRRRRRRSKGSGGQRDGGDGNRNRDDSERHDRADRVSTRATADRQGGRAMNDKSASTNQEETPVEEVATHLRSFLGGLTEAFGLEGDVDIDQSESNVMVATVQGQHGLLVGPKGRTLDAIQELARVSSQRAAPSSVRIRVDVGGYRVQRAEALAGFAAKAADKAVSDGNEVALEPMSPADRKSVHDALVEDDRVETRSVGTEPRRRVIVIPIDEGAAADYDESDESDEEE